jgi:hypothetical protein
MPETRQKYIESTVSKVEIVKEGGKWIKKTVSKKVRTPQWEEVDLYDESDNVIGKYNAPVMEQFGSAENPDEWVLI